MLKAGPTHGRQDQETSTEEDEEDHEASAEEDQEDHEGSEGSAVKEDEETDDHQEQGLIAMGWKSEGL